MHTLQILMKRQRQIRVLEQLEREPNYAYNLQKNSHIKLRKSSLYNVLKELKQLGYTQVKIEHSTNSPVRHLHSITKSGRAFLSRERLAYALDVAAALAWCKQTYQSLNNLQRSLLGK